MTQESLDEMMRRIEAEPYTATIERYQRWGPFAWYVQITKGLMMCENGYCALTEKRAEHKARRVIRRMEAADARRLASRRTVSA